MNKWVSYPHFCRTKHSEIVNLNFMGKVRKKISIYFLNN